MNDLFTWSFCFMPNAMFGTPHIGHLLHVAVIRWLYSYIAIMREENQWPVRLQWNVYFDCDAPAELADAYLDMLDWVGWPPDRIDTRRDWLRVSQGPLFLTHGDSNRLINIISFMPQSCGGGDPHRLLHKLMYWRETGTYWVVRGPDLMAQSNLESVATTHLPFLQGLPRYFYHPLVADGNGKKIDCKDCADEYRLGDLIEADHDPDDVLRAVLQSANYLSARGGDLSPLFHPDREDDPRPERRVVRWAQELFAYHNGPMGWYDPTFLRCKLECNNGGHINVPINWRDNLIK